MTAISEKPKVNEVMFIATSYGDTPEEMAKQLIRGAKWTLINSTFASIPRLWSLAFDGGILGGEYVGFLSIEFAHENQLPGAWLEGIYALKSNLLPSLEKDIAALPWDELGEK